VVIEKSIKNNNKVINVYIHIHMQKTICKHLRLDGRQLTDYHHAKMVSFIRLAKRNRGGESLKQALTSIKQQSQYAQTPTAKFLSTMMR
jgi:hypothetical protein